MELRVDGDPALVMRDADGDPRATLRQAEGDWIFALCDLAAETGLTLSLSDGKPQIAIVADGNDLFKVP